MGRNSFKKEKSSFNGGQYFHFRSVYLNIAGGSFFCSEMSVLILWYSRVRIFPQKGIEEGYLTKKKNNYCWLLASCNILFFVFRFLCNILTHFRNKKAGEIYPDTFFFPSSPVESHSSSEASQTCGALYCFLQRGKITV